MQEGIARARRLGALLIAAVAASLIAVAPATAAAPHDGWGFAIADDDWDWDDPGHLPSLGNGFADLAPKAFRLQMIWNAADLPWHMDRARTMIAQARSQGVEQIVVTFKKSVGQDVDPVYGSRPSADGYAEHVDEVVRQLAGDVDVWGPANEPNRGEAWLPGVSGAQLLAQYYARFEQIVANRDPTAQITSPDFVDRTDLGTIGAYVDAYEAAGGGWGDRVAFHPYWGAHSQTTTTTLDLIGLAPPGARIWVTEVGSFARDQGAIEASETDQNDKVWWLATTLAELPQVERIHYYHMRGSPTATWDTGLMELDGTPRLAWHTWCAMARGPEQPACQPVTPASVPAPPSPPTPPDPSEQAPPRPTPSPGAPSPPASEAAIGGLPPTGLGAFPTTPRRDLTAPRLAFGRLPRRVAYARLLSGLVLRVRSSEPATLRIGLAVRPAAGGRWVTVARKRRAIGGRRLVVVRVEPHRERLGANRQLSVRIRISAIDRDGNRAAATRWLRVVP